MSDSQTATDKDRAKPLALRRVSADTAALCNAVGQGRAASFALDERTVRIDVNMDDFEPDMRDDIAVGVDTVHGMLRIQPAGALVRLLTGVDLPGAGQGGKSRLHEWAIEAAMKRLPEAWTRLLQVKTLVLGGKTAPRAHLTLRLHVEGQPTALAVRVSGSARTLARIFSGRGWRRKLAPQVSRIETLPVRQPFVIAAQSMSAQQAARLAVGDLILLHQPFFNGGGVGTMWFGDRGMQGRIFGKGPDLFFKFDKWSVRMNRSNQDDEGDMHEDGFDDDLDEHAEDDEYQDDGEHEEWDDEGDGDDDDDGGEGGGDEHPVKARAADEDDGAHVGDLEPSAPVSMDTLPMKLVFEVGTLDMPLASLRRLAPGSVVSLNSVSPPVVTIRCNGAEAGLGELIEVEGRLAVEITELWARHADQH